MQAALVRDVRGVSVIEFALALPLFLTAIFGGLEATNLALAQQKVAEIASEVASNAARGTGQIDESDISQIMTGARLSSGNSGILAGGRVILSSVRMNAARTGQWIEWQRCDGDDRTIRSAYGEQGKGKSDSTLQRVGPSPGIRAVEGVNIMVAEVQTTYRPLVGNGFAAIVGNKTLRVVTAHVVRDRTTFGIKNDSGASLAQIKSC